MNDRKKKTIQLVADLICVIVLVLIDQYTKLLAVRHLSGGDVRVLITDVLELRYLENSGAAFGFMQNQKILFLLIASLVVLLIIYVIFRMPVDKRYRALNILLVMIMSGALGNMIDRIRNPYVVDFIYISAINFPIFNMADIYVTVSAFFFVLLILFYYNEHDFGFLSIRQQKKVREWK